MATNDVLKARTVSYEKTLRYAIFLGLIGIDRFYLGDPVKGILKLLTLSCYGIFWIVDIIIIRSHKDDWDEWIESKQAKKVEAHASTDRLKEEKRIHDELASNGQCPRCKSMNLTAVSETKSRLSAAGAVYQLSNWNKYVPKDTMVAVTKRVCLNCGYQF